MRFDVGPKSEKGAEVASAWAALSGLGQRSDQKDPDARPAVNLDAFNLAHCQPSDLA
jgi:hypothetical protein